MHKIAGYLKGFLEIFTYLPDKGIDHGNIVHGSQLPATTDPPQVTVKIFLREKEERLGAGG